MLGPYIKSRGTRGTEMSANADLITLGTYVQQGETIWKPVFHTWAKMNKYLFLLFGGGGGVLVGPLCRTQVNENFRAVRPHHRADVSFSYLGHNSKKIYSTLVTSDILGPVKIEKFHCHLAGGANKMQQDK